MAPCVINVIPDLNAIIKLDIIDPKKKFSYLYYEIYIVLVWCYNEIYIFQNHYNARALEYFLLNKRSTQKLEWQIISFKPRFFVWQKIEKKLFTKRLKWNTKRTKHLHIECKTWSKKIASTLHENHFMILIVVWCFREFYHITKSYLYTLFRRW